MSLIERLEALKLLQSGAELDAKARKLPATPEALLRLGEAGALLGGLSVALDVRPDELFGPLVQAIGGGALRLKLLDVRDRPQPELTIELGELKERWEVVELPALIHNLNDLFAEDAKTRAVAVLGEWNDALVLWAVEKNQLPRLLRERFFEPRNANQLQRFAG